MIDPEKTLLKTRLQGGSAEGLTFQALALTNTAPGQHWDVDNNRKWQRSFHQNLSFAEWGPIWTKSTGNGVMEEMLSKLSGHKWNGTSGKWSCPLLGQCLAMLGKHEPAQCVDHCGQILERESNLAVAPANITHTCISRCEEYVQMINSESSSDAPDQCSFRGRLPGDADLLNQNDNVVNDAMRHQLKPPPAWPRWDGIMVWNCSTCVPGSGWPAPAASPVAAATGHSTAAATPGGPQELAAVRAAMEQLVDEVSEAQHTAAQDPVALLGTAFGGGAR